MEGPHVSFSFLHPAVACVFMVIRGSKWYVLLVWMEWSTMTDKEIPVLALDILSRYFVCGEKSV